MRLRKIIAHDIINQAAVFKLAWLRTGYDTHAYMSPYLVASGTCAYTHIARLLSVRPATHKAVVYIYYV